MHLDRLFFAILVFSGLSEVLSKSVPTTTAGQYELELQEERGIGASPYVVSDYEDILSWNCTEDPEPEASDIAKVVDPVSPPPANVSKGPDSGVLTIPEEPLKSQEIQKSVAANETEVAGRIFLNSYAMVYKKVLQSQNKLPADNETSGFTFDTHKRASTHSRCRKTREIPDEAQKDENGSHETKNEPCNNATSGSASVKLLITENHGLAVYDMDSRNISSLGINNQHIYSVDYHFKKSLIFITGKNWIIRGSLSGVNSSSRAVARTGVEGGVRLAVDWIHDRVFWMSDKQQTVEVADLDGGNRILIIDNIKPFRYPNNIAVDPYKKCLFLVSNHTIYRTNLEGGERKILKVGGGQRKGVKCLALDIQKKKIFFSGRMKGEYSPYLASCDYDGQTVTEHSLGNHEWNDIFSLGVFQDVLYFAQFSVEEEDNLWTLDLSRTDALPDHLFAWKKKKGGIWSIRIYHPDVQNLNPLPTESEEKKVR